MTDLPRPLTAPEVIPYLIDRGLVARELLVDGDVRVEEISRRNRNFRVVSRRGPSLFIKQARGADTAATLAREAEVYRRVSTNPAMADVRPFFPRFHSFADDDNLLILELDSGMRGLRDRQSPRKAISPAVATEIGRALAAVHRHEPGAFGDSETSPSRTMPWVLWITRPGIHSRYDMSAANLRLLSIVQRFSAFDAALAELRRSWRHRAFVHNDVKWDNVVARRAGRRTVIRLVDWELAAPGDPGWDLGSELASYLGEWVFSIPVTRDASPERLIQLAVYPIEKMKPAIAAFWWAYVGGMGLDASARRECLIDGLRYAAARLIQSTYERLQAASFVSGNDVCALQLSLNLLQRPDDAAVRLLGLVA